MVFKVFTWFPCFHQVCVQNPVVFVCCCPGGHGPVGAGGLGQVWPMALDLSPPADPQHSCSLECLWDTFPVFWHLLLHLHPLFSTSAAGSAVSPVPPPELPSLHCRSILCQDVWSPAPGSSWQCHGRSWSFHLHIFIELAASIYCSLRSCFVCSTQVSLLMESWAV